MKIYAEKNFVAIEENMPAILAWLEEKSNEFLSFPVAMKMQLAGEEAVVNVVSYAYDGVEDDADRPLKLAMGCDDDGMVFLELRDSGKPFNPLKNINADPTLSLEERSLGGWGRMIIIKTMDDVTYNYRAPENILRIRKKNVEMDISDIPE